MGFATCGKRLRAELIKRGVSEATFSWTSGIPQGVKSVENTPEVRKYLQNFNIKIDDVGCVCHDSGVCDYK
jgi:hypothetical protein